MSKSKRLMELMMTVNRKRKFTVGELAREFGVSQRTILRDLQELGELGVPLYSEVGPHGGYQVLRERLLPPIAFTEEEAVSIFFAVHALRHYSSLPFETESSSALKKFYAYMPEDVRERIDQMKNRVDFITPARKAVSPYLSTLLDAAVQQKVLLIRYQSREKVPTAKSSRSAFLRETASGIAPPTVTGRKGCVCSGATAFIRLSLRQRKRWTSAIFILKTRHPRDARSGTRSVYLRN